MRKIGGPRTPHIYRGFMNVALVEAGYKTYSRWYLVQERKIYPAPLPNVSGDVARWDQFCLCGRRVLTFLSGSSLLDIFCDHGKHEDRLGCPPEWAGQKHPSNTRIS